MIVPTLQKGTYYILVYGETSNGNTQSIDLTAEILNFSIRNINAEKGGNTGNVTVQINGSKLEPNMAIRLENHFDTIVAHTSYFTNSTAVYATFDLSGKIEGFYDVVIVNNKPEQATLINGFEIVKGIVTTSTGGGTPSTGGGGNTGSSNFICSIEDVSAIEDQNLGTNYQHPSRTRPNRVVGITIHFANLGNVDIETPTRFIISLEGAPLAFEVDDLPDNAQELFLELKEEGGPPNILRPGASGSLTVYAKATSPLLFVIQE